MKKTTGRSKAAPAEEIGRPEATNQKYEMPYTARVTIRGVASILLHAWNIDAIAQKAGGKKGSQEKKTDNTESYVLRCEDGTIGIPGDYLYACMVGTAAYLRDPRSSRKSAKDLYKAAVFPTTEIASLGHTSWNYLSAKRAVVHMSGITRIRPAFLPGWTATFDLQVALPEYVQPTDLLELLTLAGRITGLGDFRPRYGRFQVTHFETSVD